MLMCTTQTTELEVSELAVSELDPGDVATVRTVFDGLSPLSRYRRFHAAMPTLGAGAARQLAATVPGRHHVFVGRIAGRPVGLARWYRIGDDPPSAECAIEVVDRYHRRGIGERLLSAAADSAAAYGIELLVAHVLADNRPIRRWGADLGAAPGEEPEQLLVALDANGLRRRSR